MKDDALLPCPFCGEEQPPHDDTSWVRCLGCGAESGWRSTGAEAIAAWNTRADTPQAAAKADWQSHNAAIRLIPTDAAAALEERDKQVRDDTVRSAAIAAGNAIVAIAADADPDISPLRKQMLRVKMEKAVKAAFTRDA
jgi:Lar family restriction alleviation protein